MADFFNAASKVFNKSVEVGSDLFDKGVSAAGDMGKTVSGAMSKSKIKAKLYDESLGYDKLMKELGKAVYDQIKDDPKYADANKDLLDKIAASIERTQILNDELAELGGDDAAKPDDVEASEAKTAEKEPEVVDVEAEEVSSDEKKA